MMRIKEADLHITMECTGHCAYCYVDHGQSEAFRGTCQYGNTEELKKIIRNIREAGGAEDLVFVGGDPCEHPDLVTLLKYAKELGLRTVVLSNTHVYRDGGKIVPMDEVVPYLDEMDFTLHGDEEAHDAFNGNAGAYRAAVTQIRCFMRKRSSEQSVGVIVNLTPESIDGLEDALYQIIKELRMDPEQDCFIAQRIAPVGLATEDYERWRLTRKKLEYAIGVFETIEIIYGLKLELDAVDAIPFCALPERYRSWLTPNGGCQWGQPDGVLSVLPDGRIQRCALSAKTIGNFCELDTPEKFDNFMSNNETLIAFREKRHLSEKCKQCKMLSKCGGGCVLATGGDPYATDEIPIGQDYLV